jgi:hypothetical protein
VTRVATKGRTGGDDKDTPRFNVHLSDDAESKETAAGLLKIVGMKHRKWSYEDGSAWTTGVLTIKLTSYTHPGPA